MVDSSDEIYHGGGEGTQEEGGRIVCFPILSQGSVGYIRPDRKSGQPGVWLILYSH